MRDEIKCLTGESVCSEWCNHVQSLQDKDGSFLGLSWSDYYTFAEQTERHVSILTRKMVVSGSFWLNHGQITMLEPAGLDTISWRTGKPWHGHLEKDALFSLKRLGGLTELSDGRMISLGGALFLAQFDYGLRVIFPTFVIDLFEKDAEVAWRIASLMSEMEPLGDLRRTLGNMPELGRLYHSVRPFVDGIARRADLLHYYEVASGLSAKTLEPWLNRK